MDYSRREVSGQAALRKGTQRLVYVQRLWRERGILRRLADNLCNKNNGIRDPSLQGGAAVLRGGGFPGSKLGIDF